MSSCNCKHDGNKLTSACGLHAQYAREYHNNIVEYERTEAVETKDKHRKRIYASVDRLLDQAYERKGVTHIECYLHISGQVQSLNQCVTYKGFEPLFLEAE